MRVFLMGSVYANQTLEKAASAVKKGRVTEASGLFLKVLEAFPQNNRAQKGLIFTHEAIINEYKPSLINLFKQGRSDVLLDNLIGLSRNITHSVFLWTMMGLAFTELRRFDDAITVFNRALELEPENADILNNIGNALQSHGDVNAAIDAYQRAAKIKPNNAEAYRNMGIAHQKLGWFKDALVFYELAVSFKPDYAACYNDIGNVLQLLGRRVEAVEAYKKALDFQPIFLEARRNIGHSLQGVVFKSPNPAFISIISSLIDHKTIVRPRDISKTAISLLKVEPAFKSMVQKARQITSTSNLMEFLSCFSEMPLLEKLMRVCPVDDPEIEAMLVEIRSAFLLLGPKFSSNTISLQFQSALAQQCFINEFIYPENSKENNALEKLEQTIQNKIERGFQICDWQILCLAAYKPLHKLYWCKKISPTDQTLEVVKQQISEPLYEDALKFHIQSLHEICDDVSMNIKQQYEENPYPRWVQTGLPLGGISIATLVKDQHLSLRQPSITNVEKPMILVAGCGTGQHAISVAARFQHASILAMDLSLSSLAYAKRKADELEVKNLHFLQGDILNLHNFADSFHVIECAGVLHHLGDPEKGWRQLTNCLKPGGLMKIALYSEIARKDVVTIRKEIEELEIAPNTSGMLNFRNHIINSEAPHHRRIVESTDFYSLSEFRDLLFNLQEHRFTLLQIKAILDRLDLHFCGFEINKEIQKFKLIHPNPASAINLDTWSLYENENPTTFNGMYQFWCQSQS